mgnify:CR=1 FL=1
MKLRFGYASAPFHALLQRRLSPAYYLSNSKGGRSTPKLHWQTSVPGFGLHLISSRVDSFRMIANRVLTVILFVLRFVIIPLQLITTFVLGIAVHLTFGLLLLPISCIWMLLLFPMIGVSWLAGRNRVLREILGFLFLPWAVIAYSFAALMPSMGEVENRTSKLMLTESWPFTWELWEFFRYKRDLNAPDFASTALREVLARVASGVPIMEQVILKISTRQQLD